MARLIDDLNICSDERYLPESELSNAKELGWRVHNLINGYGRYVRKRKAARSGELHESSIDYDMEKVAPPPSGAGMDSDPF